MQFNEKIETHVIGERKWNDSKNKKENFKKGLFSDDEVKKLMHALCEYANQQEDPEGVLNALCTKSKAELPKELYGAWPKIAEILPERTV